MQITNTTQLDSDVLERLIHDAVAGWPTRRLRVKIRYSRTTDFSGTCYYKNAVIHVNLGRHLGYPYRMTTSLARARTTRRAWSKPLYTLELADGYRVVLFVFLHEFYHWLVYKARRNARQKESMCDRFAARILVDRFGCLVCDPAGHPAARDAWDFQDLDRFVAAARPAPARPRAAKRPLPSPSASAQQLLLFNP